MPLASDSATREALKFITANNQVQSPLLRLPPEIRNQIYVSAFNETIKVCAKYGCFASTARRILLAKSAAKLEVHAHYPPHLLSLLEVCQKIYAEAKILVFSSTLLTGEVEGVDDFLWGQTLTLSQKSALVSLRVDASIAYWHMRRGRLEGDDVEVLVRRLESVDRILGLKEMVIRAWIYCYGVKEIDKAVSMLKARLQDAVDGKAKTVKVEVTPVRVVDDDGY